MNANRLRLTGSKKLVDRALYLVTSSSTILKKIDPLTGAELGSLSAPAGSTYFNYPFVLPDNRLTYRGDDGKYYYTGNTLPLTHNLINSWAPSMYSHCSSLDGLYLYRYSNGMLYKLRVSDFQEVASGGTGSSYKSLINTILSPDGSYVYVFYNYNSNSWVGVEKYNAQTCQLIYDKQVLQVSANSNMLISTTGRIFFMSYGTALTEYIDNGSSMSEGSTFTLPKNGQQIIAWSGYIDENDDLFYISRSTNSGYYCYLHSVSINDFSTLKLNINTGLDNDYPDVSSYGCGLLHDGSNGLIVSFPSYSRIKRYNFSGGIDWTINSVGWYARNHQRL